MVMKDVIGVVMVWMMLIFFLVFLLILVYSKQLVQNFGFDFIFRNDFLNFVKCFVWVVFKFLFMIKDIFWFSLFIVCVINYFLSYVKVIQKCVIKKGSYY